jgi:hypothetical protein
MIYGRGSNLHRKSGPAHIITMRLLTKRSPTIISYNEQGNKWLEEWF